MSEMKQLESLIDRLSNSFEAKLAENNTAALPPRDDAALRAVKHALSDGRVDCTSSRLFHCRSAACLFMKALRVCAAQMEA